MSTDSCYIYENQLISTFDVNSNTCNVVTKNADLIDLNAISAEIDTLTIEGEDVLASLNTAINVLQYQDNTYSFSKPISSDYLQTNAPSNSIVDTSTLNTMKIDKILPMNNTTKIITTEQGSRFTSTLTINPTFATSDTLKNSLNIISSQTDTSDYKETFVINNSNMNLNQTVSLDFGRASISSNAGVLSYKHSGSDNNLNTVNLHHYGSSTSGIKFDNSTMYLNQHVQIGNYTSLSNRTNHPLYPKRSISVYTMPNSSNSFFVNLSSYIYTDNSSQTYTPFSKIVCTFEDVVRTTLSTGNYISPYVVFSNNETSNYLCVGNTWGNNAEGTLNWPYTDCKLWNTFSLTCTIPWKLNGTLTLTNMLTSPNDSLNRDKWLVETNFIATYPGQSSYFSKGCGYLTASGVGALNTLRFYCNVDNSIKWSSGKFYVSLM